MEATEASLDIKFTQLKMTIGKTNTVLEAGKSEAIERHLSTLRSLTTEINRMRQEDGITQTLVAAKSRLAKRELTVPRLELVSAHMATNLVRSTQRSRSSDYPLLGLNFCWLGT